MKARVAPTPHAAPPPLPAPVQGFMFGDKLLRPAMVKVSFREDGGEAAAAPDDAAASGSE